MNYIIKEFNPSTGTILVEYLREGFPPITNSIPLPLEGGVFIQGADLDSYIKLNEPSKAFEDLERVRSATPPSFTLTPSQNSSAPSKVTRRQFKLALFDLGLLEEVDTYIYSSNDERLKLEWREALDIERSNPYIEALANSLGKTAEQLDDIFRLAYTL